MKRIYPFARKTRQLKYRRKLLKRLLLSGLCITLSHQQLRAQDFEFNAPIDITVNNYCPLDFYVNDSIHPTSLGSKVITSVKFIDIDDDGDQDVFYSTFDERCLACDPDLPSVTNIIFQENVSNTTIDFANPEVLYVLPFPAGLSAFEVFNFDDDNDFDFGILSSEYDSITATYQYGLRTFENQSNQFNEFELNFSEIILDINSTSLELLDVDFDGDDDLVFGTVSVIIIEPSFTYLEHQNNNQLFPFDTSSLDFDFNNQDSILSVDSSAFAKALNFIDFDQDGAVDLLLHTLKLVSDDGYQKYYQDRLYFHKNSSSNSFDFDLDGELLLTSEAIYAEFYSKETTFHLVDLDNDGDVDIIENKSSLSYSCGYCGGYTGMDSILFHENITDLTSSINEQKQTLEVKILGNPSSDKSIIQFENLSKEKAYFKLYNSTGVLLQELTTSNESFVIHKQHLETGIYFFNISVDGKSSSGKIIFSN